jgi:serine protease Do
MSQVTIPSVVDNVVGLGRGARRGSGLAIGAGRVLTLVRNLRAEQVELTVPARELRATGRLAGVDRRVGLAVLDSGLADGPEVSWSRERPEQGAEVIAAGDPGSGLRVTAGLVSAPAVALRGRDGRGLKLIEHTAPLPHGAGGGPLADGDGQVLGLNVMRGDPGFLLALPAAEVLAALARAESGHRPRRLRVAVAGPAASRRMRAAVGLPAHPGLLVRDLDEDGPAGRAGVRAGDLLTALDGAELSDPDALLAALESGPAGVRRLTVLRATEELVLDVDLEDAP